VYIAYTCFILVAAAAATHSPLHLSLSFSLSLSIAAAAAAAARNCNFLHVNSDLEIYCLLSLFFFRRTSLNGRPAFSAYCIIPSLSLSLSLSFFLAIFAPTMQKG
jgi:hypothetical protein